MAANERTSNRASQGGDIWSTPIPVIRNPIDSTLTDHVRAPHIPAGEFRLPPAGLLSLEPEQNPLTAHSQSPKRFQDPLAAWNETLEAEFPWLNGQSFCLNPEKISVGVESFLLNAQYILLDP